MKYPKGQKLIVKKNYYQISKSNVSINMDSTANKDMIVVSTDNYCNSEYNGMSLKGWAQSHGFKINEVFDLAIKYKYLNCSDEVNLYKSIKQCKIKEGQKKPLKKAIRQYLNKEISFWDYRTALRDLLDTSTILFEYRDGGMRINVDSPHLDKFYTMIKRETSGKKYNTKLREKKFGETFSPSAEALHKTLA